ncbi:hypothetical protein [Pseudanabaena sp. PCC 6802]|uniref:hypothetical protein n=1 Tax=Pseudanabaena sp. PCC 6802 TaxID=118173 RepID=UPI00034B1113|nr:hypothetical protein [Pseudanabaena sp. PCC 6802]
MTDFPPYGYEIVERLGHNARGARITACRELLHALVRSCLAELVVFLIKWFEWVLQHD